MTSVAAFPDIEVSLVTELTSHFGDGYRFCSILPENILTLIGNEVVVSRVKRVSGGGAQRGNFYIDEPIVDVDTFYKDYGQSSLAARDVQAALLDLRGKRLMIGVVQSVRPIVGPRWLPDPNPQLYRFGASYTIRFHSGGRTV